MKQKIYSSANLSEAPKVSLMRVFNSTAEFVGKEFPHRDNFYRVIRQVEDKVFEVERLPHYRVLQQQGDKWVFIAQSPNLNVATKAYVDHRTTGKTCVVLVEDGQEKVILH